MTMNEPNMPKPNRKAVRFVVQTARMRIIRMSTSGAAERDSDAIQAATPTIASATSQAASRADPSQLIAPGVRTGDSGIATSAPTAAIATAMNGSQKSQG